VGARKLSGRLGSGLNVRALAALTERELGVEQRTIEPQSGSGEVRLQKDLRKEQSGIDVMLTGVERRNDVWSRDFLRGGAYSDGLDMRHRC